MENKKEKDTFSFEYMKTSGVVSSENQRLYHPTHIKFRIAVLPTQDNLNRAKNALASILFKNKLNFHILCLNGEKSYDELGWDGTNALLDEISDEDRRGGEVIFEISYSEVDHNYGMKPEELKSLLLEIWQQLKQAGVILGHLCPNSECYAVETKDGLLTPFSYTNLSSDKNAKSAEHPLGGQKISRSDLKKHGISVEELEFEQEARIEATQRHVEKTKQALEREILALKNKKCQELADILRLFTPKCPSRNSDLPVFLQQNMETLEKIKWATPRLSADPRAPFNNPKLSIYPVLDSLIESWNALTKNQNVERNASRFRSSLATLTAQSNHNNGNLDKIFQAIEEKYTQSPYIMKMMEKNGCNVKAMVEQHPVRMQLLQRKLTHLENEEKTLMTYENNLRKKSRRREVKKEFIAYGTMIGGILVMGLGLFLIATGVASILGAAMMLGGVGLTVAPIAYVTCCHRCKKPVTERENPFLETKQSEPDSSYAGPLKTVSAGNNNGKSANNDNSQATQQVDSSKSEMKENQISFSDEEDFNPRSSASYQ